MGKRELRVFAVGVVPGYPRRAVWTTALCGATAGQIKLCPIYPRLAAVFPRGYPPKSFGPPHWVDKLVENVGITAQKHPQ